MLTNAIVRLASKTFANGLTSVDLEAAVGQYWALLRGVGDVWVEGGAAWGGWGYPDSVFVEDTAVLT